MLSTRCPRVISTRAGLVIAPANNRSHPPLSSGAEELASPSGSTERVLDRREADPSPGGQVDLTMRGYFAAGTDGISKPMNLGNLLRIAHAFGASFFFTVAGRAKLADAISDPSDAAGHLPIYQFGTAKELRLPQACELVAVEITEDAVE